MRALPNLVVGQGLSFSVDPRDGMAAGLARSAEELIYRVYEDSELEAGDIQAATNGAVLGDAVYKVFWDRDRAHFPHFTDRISRQGSGLSL